MPAPRNRDVLVKVARMYYEDNLSQQQVAEELGLSRANVSRILASAREQGIVDIRIHDPSGRDTTLEGEIQSAFGLADCRVVSGRPYEAALRQVGPVAAEWLLDSLRAEQRVSLSWGRTLQAMVDAVDTDRTFPVEVLPLVGGLSSVTSEITGEELVRELATRLGTTFQRLHAPALLESAAARTTLMAEPAIASVLQAAAHSSLSFVGLGAYGVGSSAAVIDALRLTPTQRARFVRANPVGDVCARFFDADGQEIHGEVHDRVLAVSIADLRAIATVVGLAVGEEKARGVLGALRGGFLNVLICDDALAKALLALAER
ncbi:sugar-binding protein [Phytohabitans rumicis]|uniref:Sugar-binding protein n=2 Tax=Phytohabitans rumicis TaxID=1076125 RepID=A0A6V8KZF3_9ACTN|nr:sugar-binding protein [Phytohabitans rumicis]